MWDLALDASKEVLGGTLYSTSLLEWRRGRYRLHDLARDFAGRRLETEERRTAAQRHAGHYVEVLKEANRLYLEGGEEILEGLSLFDREWSNIEAGQAWAAANADNGQAAKEYTETYPDAGVYYLNLRLHPDTWIRWLDAGRSASVALRDRRREGATLGNLGLAYAHLGEIEKAIGYYEQQLVIAREIGERRGEGNALGNLGLAYAYLGEVEKAIGYYGQRLVIAREVGDRRGEGNALGNLGLAYARLGEVEKAIGYYAQHLVIAREIGDRRGEGNALGNLGVAYKNLGEVEKAIGYHEQDLVIAHEIGDRRGAGNSLANLGLAYACLREFDKAIGYYEQQLVIAREIGNRRGEGIALCNLGIAYVDLGEVDKAIPLLEQALEIGQAVKDPRIVDAVSKELEKLRGS